MIQFVLICYGSMVWNKEKWFQGQMDNLLDQEGREQVVLFVERLSLELWDVIYLSDLGCVYEMVKIISEWLGISEIYLDLRLCEMGGGQVEGIMEVECIVKWGLEWSIFELGWEVVEVGMMCGSVVIEDICKEYFDGKVIVVSYGVILCNIF